MNIYRFTIKALSAFGTPLVGDSLFGQLCWAIVHQFGQHRLENLLRGYTQQQPFAVISDAFPHGYFPLPTLPSFLWETDSTTDRKILKKKQWIALSDLDSPLPSWQNKAKVEKDIIQKASVEQPHNSLSRQSGTTGAAGFAPYSSHQIWYAPNTLLDIYIVLDENKLSYSELHQLLSQIGTFGFGRDASIGLGKFTIEKHELFSYSTKSANAYLTLANCAPQGLNLKKKHCYYKITTRFGRHGDMEALGSNPFKKPIILAQAGAIFTPHVWVSQSFIGNGLSKISFSQENAIHQGYAPVIPITINLNV